MIHVFVGSEALQIWPEPKEMEHQLDVFELQTGAAYE
jgi:hypothetical protein